MEHPRSLHMIGIGDLMNRVLLVMLPIVVGLLPAPPAMAGSDAMCSVDPLGQFEMPGTTLFIATATADSLSGGTITRKAGGMSRDTSSIPAPAFSQVVRVERLSTSASPGLAEALKASAGVALVVPWEYGSDCATVPYTGTALWMPPGTRGFFGGELRPREQWVNGIPTFDVGSRFNTPYPTGGGFQVWLRRGTPLSVDDAMSFFDSIPRMSAARVDRVTELNRQQELFQSILRWAERHPEIASRPPVAERIDVARRQVPLAPYYMRISPLAGTWRFTVTMPGRDSVVFYARTQDRATTIVASRDGSVRTWDLNGAAPFGYSLLMRLASEQDTLDDTRWPNTTRQGYFTASFEPERIQDDGTIWDAGLELFGATAMYPDDPDMKQRLTELRLGNVIQRDTARPRYAQGRAVTTSGGQARVLLDIRSARGPLATIRGERISAVVWKPR